MLGFKSQKSDLYDSSYDPFFKTAMFWLNLLSRFLGLIFGWEKSGNLDYHHFKELVALYENLMLGF